MTDAREAAEARGMTNAREVAETVVMTKKAVRDAARRGGL